LIVGFGINNRLILSSLFCELPIHEQVTNENKYKKPIPTINRKLLLLTPIIFIQSSLISDKRKKKKNGSKKYSKQYKSIYYNKTKKASGIYLTIKVVRPLKQNTQIIFEN